MSIIQELQSLLGKKSKEEGASGAITKLAATEWNKLVQAVIEHYQANPYGFSLVDNILTITDSSGEQHIYELTPYEQEPEIDSITYIITNNNHTETPSFSAPQIPFDGAQKSTTLTYKAYKKITYKGNTTPDTYVEINSSSVPEATVTVTYEVVGESEFNLAITNTGKISCDSNTGAERDVGDIKAKITITVDNQPKITWTSDNIKVTQGAYVAPDYYVGLYSNRDNFQSATDSQILESAEGKNISTTPKYPTANSYKRFTNNEKLIYVLIKQSVNINTVTVDVDNSGDNWDRPNVPFIEEFTKESNTIVIDSITYDIYRVYDSDFTNENGYRIKFN